MKISVENLVCFDVHAASRALDAVYRRVLADLGLTYPQYLVMMVLWEREPVTVKELGVRLRLDSGTLSPLLKRLEAASLVRRERSADDERSVLVRLTSKGSQLGERACDVPAQIFGAAGLAPAEVLDLQHTLRRVIASLDESAR
ncbi:MarR family winged helix-turn-helix transcriptional regulator [Streptosporangium sp. V21-05]|uniref:MarR family winged helix-turn-helix transcriptional regulator n=1 Tax=Streptosporangium sp. V21-05 TaxID=3446115 RepID=UPI003F52EF0A